MQVELEPNQEHVEDDAELGDDPEKWRGIGRQQKRRAVGPEASQQRGPEHDPADHFADHGRLIEPGKQGADEPRGHHDDRQRQQDTEQHAPSSYLAVNLHHPSPRQSGMDNLLQDVRYGIRTLVRQPGFAATAILTLALGIGATTAIFSVVNAVVLRPMPFDQPDRVMCGDQYEHQDRCPQHHHLGTGLCRLARAGAEFRSLAYFTGSGETSVTVNNVSDYTTVTRVAPGYFRVFGAAARAGRLFTPEEEKSGDGDVVVISDAYWRRQFGSDPRAIGSTITFGQRTRTIIGVTPLRYPARTDIYYPDPIAPESQSRTAHNYRGVGRLAAGVSIAQAQAEMTGIAARLGQEYPLSNGDKGIAVVPLQEMVVGDTRQTLFVLLAAVAFVLLIACANVANLLLARAAARGRELVVRAAVGAGRLRLIRQMLTESVVLALLAGAGGVIFARWGVSALLALAPRGSSAPD